MTVKCPKCQRKLPLDCFAKNSPVCRWCKKRPELKKVTTAQTKAYRRRDKREAMERLGGAVCVWCGCDELDMLIVDHADNNGPEHRKAIGGAGPVKNRWILKVTDADIERWSLRTLCWNCKRMRIHHTDDEVQLAVQRQADRIRRQG